MRRVMGRRARVKMGEGARKQLKKGGWHGGWRVEGSWREASELSLGLASVE